MGDDSSSSEDSTSDEQSDEESISPLRATETNGTGSSIRFVSRRFSMMVAVQPVPAPAIETHALDVESPSATIERQKQGRGLLYFPPENTAEYLSAGLVLPIAAAGNPTTDDQPFENSAGPAPDEDASFSQQIDGNKVKRAKSKSGTSGGTSEGIGFYCPSCMRTRLVSKRQSFEGNGGCSHEFCTDCVNDYLFQRIRVGHHTLHPCPKSGEQGCQATATTEDVKRIVDPDVFEEHRRRIMGLSGPCENCGSRVRPSNPAQPTPFRDGRGVCHSCGHSTNFRGPWIGSPWSRSGVSSPASSFRSESPERGLRRCTGCGCGCGPRGTGGGIARRTDAPRLSSCLRALVTRGDSAWHVEAESRCAPSGRYAGGESPPRQGVLRRPCPGCESGVLQRAGFSEAQSLVKCDSCGKFWCWLCLQLIVGCSEANADDKAERKELEPVAASNEHYSWWNIRGCPGARLTNPKVWDGEYLPLYRALIAVLVLLVGPIFVVLRGVVLVISYFVSPLGLFSCGYWRFFPDMISFFIAVPLALALSIAWLPVGVVAAVLASVKVDGRRESDEGRRRGTLLFAPVMMFTSYLSAWWRVGCPRSTGRAKGFEGRVSHSGEWEQLALENGPTDPACAQQGHHKATGAGAVVKREGDVIRELTRDATRRECRGRDQRMEQSE